MEYTIFINVPKIKPIRAPKAIPNASFCFLLSIKAPRKAPKKGPIIRPIGGKNKPKNGRTVRYFKKTF